MGGRERCGRGRGGLLQSIKKRRMAAYVESDATLPSRWETLEAEENEGEKECCEVELRRADRFR